jgi:hypothetical protein
MLSRSSEPVAKPQVLQLAEGVKLLPTVAGFGVTSGKSIIYSSKAEVSGRSGASVGWGFATSSNVQTVKNSGCKA